MEKLYFEEKGPALLKRIGMSKSEFARRMGIRKQNVNALFKSANVHTIRRASEVLDVPFALLVSYASEPDIEREAASGMTPDIAPGRVSE